MHVIPVLDIMNGVAVRAIAGRRADYRPLQSRWTKAVAPCAILEALREAFRPCAFYVADLDAIQTATLNILHYEQMREWAACPLWLDAGTLQFAQALAIQKSGCGLVAGLESYPDPAPLRGLLGGLSPHELTFSLDLRNGEPLERWPLATTPLAITDAVYEMGIRRLIVLDLARVGTGVGPGPVDLLVELRCRFPKLMLIAGGGVHAEADLHTLAAIGVDAVLVGSALHDGRLTPDVVRAFNESDHAAVNTSTPADQMEPDCS